MHVFDIIGPIMLGPSSSHTAGLARIGRAARAVFGEAPERVEIVFHVTFRETVQGHGSDRAIVGGLLGFAPDDDRIRDSLSLAESAGMCVSFRFADLGDVHPNSLQIELRGRDDHRLLVEAVSTGGGGILIKRLNHLAVEVACEYPTLLVRHRDRPGVIRGVAGALELEQINIAGMRVYRAFRGGEAVMVIETDQGVTPAALRSIREQPEVLEAMEIAALNSGLTAMDGEPAERDGGHAAKRMGVTALKGGDEA